MQLTVPANYNFFKLSPTWQSWLRSNHAGETGAVWIYCGVLAVAWQPEIRAFAKHHLATERAHLELMHQLVPRLTRSKLLLLWRPAGFILGVVAALGSKSWFGRSIEAVETFVEEHYNEQISAIDRHSPEQLQQLQPLLISCCEDEVAHKEEGAAFGKSISPSKAESIWQEIISKGSRIAVAIAKRV